MIEETENQEQSLEDLIEIVERDDLPTNIYTNETTDPMVLLGKINEVIGYLRQLQATITSSDTKANQALASAIQALETANTALSSSTTALTNANQALSTANTAISSANSAVETANTASTTAGEAKQTAEGIAGTANQALTNANQALSTANTANNTANSASTTAVNANITANNANTTAQQALTTAQGKQDQLSQTQLENIEAVPALSSQVQAQESSISTLSNVKVTKTDSINKIYGTDSNGNQTTIDYQASQTNSANKIVRRDNNGDVLVPSTPSSNNGATSKSYVDNLTTPTQWQNATLNSTYISGGTCRYCVVGKIVIVQMWDIRFTQTAVNNFSGGNNLVAISGLPTGYAGLVNVCTGSQNIITLNVTNGNMTNWYSAPTSASNYYNANFAYIKED